jgi:hypothetical protein
MIIRLQSASLNHFLLKLSGELPVHIGEKRETARLFEEHRDAIGSLMTEIMQPLHKLGSSLRDDDEVLIQVMRELVIRYSFIELLYSLDENGIQRSENISVDRTLSVHKGSNQRGKDRSTRPYYQQAKARSDLVITEPYVSMATCDYCISRLRRRRCSPPGAPRVPARPRHASPQRIALGIGPRRIRAWCQPALAFPALSALSPARPDTLG